MSKNCCPRNVFNFGCGIENAGTAPSVDLVVDEHEIAGLRAGAGITIDDTDPKNIVITGTGGTVVSLSPGSGISCTPNPITGTGTIANTGVLALTDGGSSQTLIRSSTGQLYRVAATGNLSITPSMDTLTFNASGVASLTNAATGAQTLIFNSSGVLYELDIGSLMGFNTTVPGIIKIFSNASGPLLDIGSDQSLIVSSPAGGPHSQLKQLKQGTNITFTDNGDNVQIDATGGSSVALQDGDCLLVVSPSVSSGNLTITIQNQSFGTPSSGNPAYVNVEGILYGVVAANSWTLNSGTNYFQCGAVSTATFTSDLFVYAVTHAATLFFFVARLPGATSMASFHNFTITIDGFYSDNGGYAYNAADPCRCIARFGAILSGTGTFAWSLPSPDPVISYGITYSRKLNYNVAISATSSPPVLGTTGSLTGSYQILPNGWCEMQFLWQFGSGGSISIGSGSYTALLPIDNIGTGSFDLVNTLACGMYRDAIGGNNGPIFGIQNAGTNSLVTMTLPAGSYLSDASFAAPGTGSYFGMTIKYQIV